MKKLLIAFGVVLLGAPWLVAQGFIDIDIDIDWDDIYDQLSQSEQFQSAIDTLPAHEKDNVTKVVAASTTSPSSLELTPTDDASIVIGSAGGPPFNASECGGRGHYGELSHRQGNTFCYGPAPDGYKAKIDPYLCQNMEQYFRTCPTWAGASSITTITNNVPDPPEDFYEPPVGGSGPGRDGNRNLNQASGLLANQLKAQLLSQPQNQAQADSSTCGFTAGATWGPPGKPSTSAFGTWTSWWKGVSAYCVDNGYWESSNASSLPDVNNSASFQFTVASSDGSVEWKAEELQNDKKMVAARGWNEASSGGNRRVLTSPTFNSPFIYLKNQITPVMVRLQSAWNQYTSQTPEFNLGNGWEVESEPIEPLFYELGLTEVELSRSGQLFTSQSELTDFLQNSDFFDRLGFSDAETENSLSYLLPKIPEAPYYYLTILSSDSVAQLSQMDIDPAPETFVRRYFAVYPTQTPVLTTGELDFPEVVPDAGFTVRDYGEILVTPDMFVNWES